MSEKTYGFLRVQDKGLMTFRESSEGPSSSPIGVASQARYVGFDIETYSPNGFPGEAQDPVVAVTLAMSPSSDFSQGLMVISLMCPPASEERLLEEVRCFLNWLEWSYLVTYNGARFDLPYFNKRCMRYGYDASPILNRLQHLDLYETLWKSPLRLPNCHQKTVEKSLGIKRNVDEISGANYYTYFPHFLRAGDPSTTYLGCLRILQALRRLGYG